jgi:hypothetical protein
MKIVRSESAYLEPIVQSSAGESLAFVSTLQAFFEYEKFLACVVDE